MIIGLGTGIATAPTIGLGVPPAGGLLAGLPGRTAPVGTDALQAAFDAAMRDVAGGAVLGAAIEGDAPGDGDPDDGQFTGAVDMVGDREASASLPMPVPTPPFRSALTLPSALPTDRVEASVSTVRAVTGPGPEASPHGRLPVDTASASGDQLGLAADPATTDGPLAAHFVGDQFRGSVRREESPTRADAGRGEMSPADRTGAGAAGDATLPEDGAPAPESITPVQPSILAAVPVGAAMAAPAMTAAIAAPIIAIPGAPISVTVVAGAEAPTMRTAVMQEPSIFANRGPVAQSSAAAASFDLAEGAPVGVAMRDVSALLAVQPGAVTLPSVPVQARSTMPSAMTPPAIGIAEATIRKQVAAMVDEGNGGAAIVSPTAAPGDPVVTTGPLPNLPQAMPAGQASTPPVLGADAALALHVDAAREGATLDSIARDIAAGGDVGTPMRFRIDAPRLGPVTVDLSGGAAALAVRMTTQGAEVRDRIVDAEARLVTDARAAGVQIASVQVIDKPAEARRDPAPQSAPQQQAAGGGSAGVQTGGQPGGQASANAGQGGAGRQSQTPSGDRPAHGTAGVGAASRTVAASELYA